MKLAIGVLCAVLILGGIGIGAIGRLRREGSSGACARTVAPGSDIAAAVFDAPAGATVCLAAGTHRPFSVARVRPGVTLKGAGADTTSIQAARGNVVQIADVERFTLADLSVRGGGPAGIYAARATGLTIRSVRVDLAATGIHVENGGTLLLEDVSIAGSQDFGLLLRRGVVFTGERVQVRPVRGIGIGAVDEPGSFTLRQSTVERESGRGEGMVLNGWERFDLTDVSVRGGNPAGIYVARARQMQVRGLRVQRAVFGLHLDENAVVNAEDVTLTESTGVGLLLQRGGTFTGRAVQVLDTAGTGVSSINGAGLLTLRDSHIARVAAAGLFTGVAGCEDLPPASLEVPSCFYKDLQAQISTSRTILERVTMEDTQGPCLVFFPGVHAEVRESVFRRCELTGLFAWGAVADVSNSLFEDNAEHALEYRAFPDPRAEVIRAAAGTIQDTVVRSTRPLQGEVLGALGPGPILGGGILAQGSRLLLRRNDVSANRDIGISFVNRSSGEVVESRIVDNGSYALCLVPGVTVEVRDNTIAGNRSNNLGVCGGQPAAPR